MGIERVNGHGQPPKLEAVQGTSRRPETTPDAEDTFERGDAEEPDGAVVRPAKVAEARLKILNDYYSRRDIQLALAERLILELGA